MAPTTRDVASLGLFCMLVQVGSTMSALEVENMAQGMDSDYSDWSLGGKKDKEHEKEDESEYTEEDKDNKHMTFNDDDKKESASHADVNGNFSIDRVISFGAPGWIHKSSTLEHFSGLKGLRVYNSKFFLNQNWTDPIASIACPWDQLGPCFWHSPGLDAMRIQRGNGFELVQQDRHKQPNDDDNSYDEKLHVLHGDSGYYKALEHLPGLSCRHAQALCDVGAADENDEVNVTKWKLLLHLSYNSTTGAHKDTFETQYVFLDKLHGEELKEHEEEQEHSWLLGEGGKCYLTFKGSDSYKSWARDFDTNTSEFCELGLVHQGFKLQLKDMLRAPGFKDTLSRWFFNSSVCETRTVLGHSLAGAMAEMFSTCVQKNGLKFF